MAAGRGRASQDNSRGLWQQQTVSGVNTLPECVRGQPRCSTGGAAPVRARILLLRLTPAAHQALDDDARHRQPHSPPGLYHGWCAGANARAGCGCSGAAYNTDGGLSLLKAVSICQLRCSTTRELCLGKAGDDSPDLAA
jgi:hypothetical protein